MSKVQQEGSVSPAIDDDGFVSPKVSQFKLAAPGDYIKGKYLGSKDFDGKFGPTKSHQIEAEAGITHETDPETNLPVGDAIQLVPGATYGVIEKPIFSDKISQARSGQRVIVQFVEMRKSKQNGKAYKYIDVKLDSRFEEKNEDVPFL